MQTENPSGQFDVVAIGTARIPIADLPALRRQRPPVPESAGAALALRQSDEHTLAALQGLLDSIRSSGQDIASFGAWGVMVASRYPGRVAMAHLMHRYSKLGAAGVSPMTSATQSLHSAASTLSLTLGLRGPAFGVSGGRNYVSEGLLASCTFQDARLAPGMFIVLTTSDPVLAPGRQGEIASPDSQMHAVALAVSATAAASPLLRLSMRPTREPSAQWSPTHLRELVAFMEGDTERLRIPVMGGSCIEAVRVSRASSQAA